MERRREQRANTYRHKMELEVRYLFSVCVCSPRADNSPADRNRWHVQRWLYNHVATGPGGEKDCWVFSVPSTAQSPQGCRWSLQLFRFLLCSRLCRQWQHRAIFLFFSIILHGGCLLFIHMGPGGLGVEAQSFDPALLPTPQVWTVHLRSAAIWSPRYGFC